MANFTLDLRPRFPAYAYRHPRLPAYDDFCQVPTSAARLPPQVSMPRPAMWS